MFQKGAAAAGLLAAASFMGGCEERQAAEPAYEKLDANTFIIHDESGFDPATVARNLAKFREEVPGDFVLIPTRPDLPFGYDMVAVRKTAESKDGSNTIEVPGGGVQQK